MYSVRKTTIKHGNTNLILLLYTLVITGILIHYYGNNYFVIFCSSALLHMIIETGLSISGIRVGKVYVYGRQLPRAADVVLRSLVEGPAFCVPAFFVADQFQCGNALSSIAGSIIVVGFASFFLGWTDRSNIQKLATDQQPLLSRRAMTKPGAVILLAFINSGCIAAFFLIPETYRGHAFTYLFAYSGLVLLFYFINYNLGVRYIEFYNAETKEFYKPGLTLQIAGLTYDSAYEMALLVSPAYWLTFYMGLFKV